MARKDRNQEIVLTELNEVHEPMVEAEAYNMPSPDAGADVTMYSKVGVGGPVPIIAPKHNTIQLQPIVVPLAVVPYMTQDSAVLRTDGRQPAQAEYDYGEAAEFEAYEQEEVKKKKKVKPHTRVMSFITLLLSVVAFLPFILAFTQSNKLGSLDIAEFNIIDMIMRWAKHEAEFNFVGDIIWILYIAVAGMTAIGVVTALIALIIGKYPKPLISITSCVAFLCMLAVLIMGLVDKEQPFDIKARAIMVAMVALTALIFVLTIIFTVIANKQEDKAEKQNRSTEI